MSEEQFTVYRFDRRGSVYAPRIEAATDRDGRPREILFCACGNRAYTLSSGQAKHCEHCGLLMARVGRVITIAEVERGK